MVVQAIVGANASRQLGRLVKRAREKHGWSQSELALHVGYKNSSTIARIEQGTGEPSLTQLVRLAEVLGLSLDLLVGSVGESALLRARAREARAQAQHLVKEARHLREN